MSQGTLNCLVLLIIMSVFNFLFDYYTNAPFAKTLDFEGGLITAVLTIIICKPYKDE